MSTSWYTPLEDIPKIHARAREAFLSGKAKSIAFRKEQIAQLGYLIKDNEQRFFDAMKQDMGRPALETEFFDVSSVYIDVRKAYDCIEKWTAPQSAEFSLSFVHMRPKYKSEPKGVVLLIAPFNGPIVLLLSPLNGSCRQGKIPEILTGIIPTLLAIATTEVLTNRIVHVGAIAGGNAAILKPSEQTPTTCALFAELVPRYLDPDLYHVINGGIPETTRILELQLDHILYTGSGRVGRIVAAAAAKHLTPVTLELGGKNPVVVDEKSDLKLAAKRTLWGRCLNAGQICVCPEYVLIQKDSQDAFIKALQEVHDSFYPEGSKNSQSLARIISEQQTQRIKDLLANTRGTTVIGGEVDVAKKYVAPTVVKDVMPDDPLMEDELFAPVLLIVPVEDVQGAIDIINSREHPLAIYVFSQNKAFQDKVFNNTQSGGAICNETMIQIGVPGIPMGGIGPSGYGYYTGKDMFEQFTHKRTSINNPGWIDKLGFGCRYPPYKSLAPLKLFLPSLPPRPNRKSTAP